MEISFKKITLEDRKIIDSYLEYKTYRSCELVFPNIFLWCRYFPTDYAVVEDTLVFRSQDEAGNMSVTFPAGKREQIRPALDRLLAYFQERGIPFQLYLVQEPEFRMLEEWYPGRFGIEYDRDIADYVYETENLATLAGKKYHGKRNHINRFQELYPDWSYERITEENMEECFQMAMQWRTDHECEYDPEKRNEMCVTLNALRLHKELGLVGGMLKAGGRVVAFTIGEPLNPDTIVVHIEKAFADVPGAYPMINQQFVIHEAGGFRYVNREEDTGAEGLRKAKLSYRPAFMVEKGLVREKKEDTGHDEN